jgi:hypothetical protein
MPFLSLAGATKQTHRFLQGTELRHVYIYITAPLEAAFASEGVVTVESVSVPLKIRGNRRSAG